MSNMSNWDGQPYKAEHMRFRHIPGRKRNGDRRLEVWMPDDAGVVKWLPVSMVDVFFMHEFFCDNEERVYPQVDGYKGWQYWVDALKVARKQGWQKARISLHLERAAKQDRIDGL